MATLAEQKAILQKRFEELDNLRRQGLLTSVEGNELRSVRDQLNEVIGKEIAFKQQKEVVEQFGKEKPLEEILGKGAAKYEEFEKQFLPPGQRREIFEPTIAAPVRSQPTIADIIKEAAPGIDPRDLFPTTLAPSVSALLPTEERKPFEETAAQEQAVMEAARRRFEEEQLREQSEIEEAARKEQEELEGARKRYLSEEEAAVPALIQQYRDIFQPGLERTLKRQIDVLGARGLGGGGFSGSGAVQELAKRGAQELEEQATSRALENLLGARQRYGLLGLEAAQAPSQFRRTGLERRLGTLGESRELGLEAAQVPSIYRRGAFERGLGQRDIFGERAFERELAELGASAQREVAKKGRRASIYGDILGTVGQIAGGPIGGAVGRSIGKRF